MIGEGSGDRHDTGGHSDGAHATAAQSSQQIAGSTDSDVPPTDPLPPLLSTTASAMEAEHEELSANPFWTALLKRAEMIAEIAHDKAIVCVPSSESVKLCKLTPDFLATHVLIPVPDELDLYSTRNGKTVQFSGGRVICATGFPRPRTVMVIYEETFYDDDFNAIKILRTNFPLEGKIPLAYYKSVANQAAVDLSALNARTLPEHQAVLCKMALTPAAAAALPSFSPEQALANIGVSPSPALVAHPGLPPVFASLSRFIVSFNHSYVMVKGFVDHAGSKVKDACDKIKEELIHTLPGGSSSSAAAKMSRLTSMEASAAIEACVFTGVQLKLFHTLVELYKAEEARTQAILANCDSVSMQDLGVRAELVCVPTLAVQHLQQALNGMFAVTPLQKLGVLEDTNRLLTQAVDAKLAEARAHADYNSEEKQDTTLAADDMLPLWIWLLLQSKPLHIHANLVFMEHFQPATSMLNVQQLKVHLANLQGAVQFVDSGKLGAGGAMLADMPSMMPEHPPRRVRAASTIVTNSFANLSVRDPPHASANPFARANSSTAAAAAAASSSSASASPAGFTRRSSMNRADTAAQLLDSIEDGLNEIQESQRGRPSALAVASPAAGHQHSLSTSHMRQSSMQQLHSSSSMTPQPRSELPSTRSTGLTRHGSLSHSHSSSSAAAHSAAASPAVAAAAASSVHRMGDFLAGLHRQDDGATGRLGSQHAAPQHSHSGSNSQPNSRRATGPRGFVPAGPSVLELDADDLPPLIVTRTAPQRRY